MTQFLPPNLLALFAPREPIPYKEPINKEPHDKKRVPILGIAQYVNLFEEPIPSSPKPEPESREQKKKRKRKEKQEAQAYKIEQGIALWNPHENKSATTDPYRTLFVGSINYDTSESKLKREFEQFGGIKRIKMISHNKSGKSRGYAFIEYEKERDMHSAYKRADGMKIDGKRVLVDVERGRTVKGWLPRRFGGGVGEGRKARSPGYRSASRVLGLPTFGSRDRGGGGGGGRDRDRDRGRERDSRGGDRDRRDRERGDRDRDRRDDRRRSDRGDDHRDAKRSRRDDIGGNPNHVPIGGRNVATFGGIKNEANGH